MFEKPDPLVFRLLALTYVLILIGCVAPFL